VEPLHELGNEVPVASEVQILRGMQARRFEDSGVRDGQRSIFSAIDDHVIDRSIDLLVIERMG
jgi:hypothetical protein